MNLIHIAYASIAHEEFNPSAIVRMVNAAQQKNVGLGITGMLLFGNRRFLQLIEGPRDAVNDLYHTIVRDPRHTKLRIVDYQQKYLRYFEHWHMGLVDVVSSKDPHITKVLEGREFHPELFNAQTCMELLRLGGVFLEKQKML